jgi:hypothetical protein
MRDDQRDLRKAQIAELQLALQVALEKLDRLEERIAARKILDSASPADPQTDRIAAQIAIGMTKARAASDKS